MSKNKFKNIDLIVVNFYPFQETITKIKIKITLLKILILVGPQW